MSRLYWAVLLAVLMALPSSAHAQFRRGSTYTPSLSVERFEDLTVDNTSGHRIVSDYKSRIAVRWDDIRDGAYADIEYGLKIGVPQSIAVIEDNIDAVGFMTTAALVQLQATADSTGTPLEWVYHSKSVFGAPTTPSDLTWANMQLEFNPSAVESIVGQDIVTWAQPGNASALAWVKANRTMVYTELANNGIKYGDCGYGGMNVNGQPVWNGHTVFGLLNGGPVEGTANHLIKPGHHNDPYFMPGALTIDLNNAHFIETNWGSLTWLFHEQTGATADAHWQKSFGYPVYSAIGMGGGFVMAFHDSADTYAEMAAGNVSWVGAAAGEVDSLNAEGGWSAKAALHHLKALEDATLLDLVLCKELYEWGLSEYEEGVNLLAFADGFKSPATITGDTLGVEIPWMAGMGSPGIATTTWSAGGMTNSGLDAGLGNVAKFDRAQDDPWDINANEAQGLNGRTAWTYSTGGQWNPLLIGSLPPGEYLFGFSSDNAGTSHSTRYLTTALSFVKMELENSWTGSMTPDYEDSIQVLNAYNQNIAFAETVTANESSSLFVHFTIPRDGGMLASTATLKSQAAWDPANVADGAYDSKTITVTGAALGDRAIATFGADISDMTLTAYVTGANTVRALLQNETGGAVDADSSVIYVEFEATKNGGLEFGFGPNDRADASGDYDNGWWIKTGNGVLGWEISSASTSVDFDRPTLVCLKRF